MLVVERTLLTAALEETYGVDASPSPVTDALLVDDPEFSFQGSVLERNYTRTTFSTLPHVMGRKLAKLKVVHELRGNGIQNSGQVCDAPRLARLFEACGFVLSAMASDGAIWGPYPIRPQTDVEAVTAVGSLEGLASNTDVIGYTIAVTNAGVSGAAEVSITPDDSTLDTPQTGVLVTSGSPFNVGSHGAQCTLTFTCSLTTDMAWQMAILKQGLRLDPTSTVFGSLTLYLYLDGILHKMTGAVGTVIRSAPSTGSTTIRRRGV